MAARSKVQGISILKRGKKPWVVVHREYTKKSPSRGYTPSRSSMRRVKRVAKTMHKPAGYGKAHHTLLRAK
jgi:hypothetical protein